MKTLYYFKVKLLISITELEFLLSLCHLPSDMIMPILYNNGTSCEDGVKIYSFNSTARFSRLYCETSEKKINEM